MKIPQWAADGIRLAINLLRSALIANVPVNFQNLFTKFSNRLSDTVMALADENPKDAEQLRNIWFAFLGNEASDFLLQESSAFTSRISDPKLRAIADAGTPFVISLLKIYTDDNPANAAQLKASLKALLKSDGLWDSLLD